MEYGFCFFILLFALFYLEISRKQKDCWPFGKQNSKISSRSYNCCVHNCPNGHNTEDHIAILVSPIPLGCGDGWDPDKALSLHCHHFFISSIQKLRQKFPDLGFTMLTLQCSCCYYWHNNSFSVLYLFVWAPHMNEGQKIIQGNQVSLSTLWVLGCHQPYRQVHLPAELSCWPILLT